MCSITSSVENQNISVKPILVKRGSNSSSPSSISSVDSGGATQQISSPDLPDSQIPKGKLADPDPVPAKYSLKVETDWQKPKHPGLEKSPTSFKDTESEVKGTKSNHLENTISQKVEIPTRKTRCRSAPTGRQYHWDSSTKQWFSNRTLLHEENSKPTEVRQFKLNVSEPKINRWVTGKPDATSPREAERPYRESFKCSNTVELVNSLQQKPGVQPVSGFVENSTNNHPSVCLNNLRSIYHTPSSLPEARIPARGGPLMQSSGVSYLGQRVSQDAEVGNMSLGSVYPPDQVSKSQAKAELQAISTRLGSYIQYVREVSENANQVDLAAFINSIKILEDELVNIKNMYEVELGSTR